MPACILVLDGETKKSDKIAAFEVESTGQKSNYFDEDLLILNKTKKGGGK